MRKNSKFWKAAKKCSETVKTWPLWMKQIKITAKTANTGDFIINDLPKKGTE